MSRDWCSSTAAGIRIAVQLAPKAKKTEVVGVVEDMLRIRLQAQPVDGKANEALIRFVADTLGVPKRAVKLTHGFTSKRKLLEVSDAGLTPDAVRQVFLPASGNAD